MGNLEMGLGWPDLRKVGILQDESDVDGYPLVNIQKAIENGHIYSEFSH
jgi:hypothetical protein